MNTVVLGSVVLSSAGRDRGSYYVVTQIMDNYVMIADGIKRKIEKPKKKKIKHIKPNGEVLNKIALKLADNEIIYNAEIRSALREYNENIGGINVKG